MVDQKRNLADSRLIVGCVYCDGPDETRDHVPSRVLLDSPFPENLPNVPACQECNNGFSLDEEYLACLLESVLAGSTDPDDIKRPKVAGILRRRSALRTRIEAGKRQTGDQISFDYDRSRVRNIVLKLAQGHAAFELGAPYRHEPTSIDWWPLALMSSDDRESFDAVHFIQTFGEVGSRALQRLLVVQATVRSPAGESSTMDLLVNDWVDVQDDRYRYLAVDDSGVAIVKIIIREYLACMVTWEAE